MKKILEGSEFIKKCWPALLVDQDDHGSIYIV